MLDRVIFYIRVIFLKLLYSLRLPFGEVGRGLVVGGARRLVGFPSSLRERGQGRGFLFFPLWGVGGLFLACSPVRYIGIETYNPAAITFPKEVKKVLIVNHAVPQPEVPGCDLVSGKASLSSFSKSPLRGDLEGPSADSALFAFCNALGQGIAASPYFEDVRLLEEGYRSDDYFFVDRRLTADDVTLLCDEHGVDAIISLERLMFQIKESVQKTFDFEFNGFIEIDVSGVVRTYLPGRDSPLSSIEITDTIYPQLQFDILDVGTAFISADVLLQDVSKLIAERSLVNFIPYWSEDARWYYVSSDAQWKEAAAFAVADKWERAREKWEILYDHTADSSWKQKARLASNLALSHELTGDFSKALYWATESFRLLKDKLPANDTDFKLQQMYIEVLKFRILADKRLHMQIDEKGKG